MKNVLISGGSSGIGLEVSKRFAENGFNIFWVSLYDDELKDAKAEMLNEFPNIKIDYLAKDLSETNAAKEVYDWIHTKNIFMDVLINNAGFGTFVHYTHNSDGKRN